jgi:hypothetical protein
MKSLPPNFNYQERGIPGSRYVWLIASLLLTSMTLSAQLTVNFQTIPPDCGGIDDGSITALPDGGVPPYQYLWNTGDTTQVIDGLGPGTYSVTVTDAMGESGTATEVITVPPKLGLTFNLDVCTSPGTITVTPDGGVTPYEYLWDTGEDTQTIDFLNPGQYCVTVIDANSCGVAGCVVVPTAPPSVVVTTTDVLCAGDADGTATAIPSGGAAPYTYEWNTGDTTQTITDLAPGTYCVTITDDLGCTSTDCGMVSEPPLVTVSVSGQNPFCSGDANGSAFATPGGGTPPYSYVWNTGQMTQSITGLTEGTYSVTLTDANGCTASDQVTLTDQSNILVTANATDETCFGDEDGTASAMATDGVAPYTYSWSNGQSGAMLMDLPAGTYSVTATDQLGCTAVTSVTVGTPGPFTISMSGSNVTSCGAADGSATATPVGGQSPYTYLWSNGETTQTVSGLPGGTYIVTVSDDTGCTAMGSIFIGEPTELAVEIIATDEQCDGAEDGSATANPLGGNSPYSFVWSTGQMTQTIDNLAPGVYSVTVTDSNGCFGTESVVIMPAPAFSISINGVDVLCFGDATGSASVVPAGGTPPYTYAWSNGGSADLIDNLLAGAYTVTVTDANGCEQVGVAIIEQPDQLFVTVQIDNNICEAGNATATAIVSGGMVPYSYSWSTGANTPNISGLFPGLYSVTVTDANGCSETVDFEVLPPNQLVLSLLSMPISCAGAMDGSVTADPSGGNPPYTYLWNTGAMTPSITNLGPGVYAVTVTDALGCEASDNLLLQEPTPLGLTVDAEDATCPNGNDGSAEALVSGGTPPYAYAWSNGQSGPSIDNLGPGSYSVTVTDANGCEAATTFMIDSESDLQLGINVLTQPCPGGASGSLEAVATGGVGSINYIWNTGESTPVITDLSAGTYGVTVTDDAGCVASSTIDLQELPGPNCLAVVTQPVSEPGASDGIVTVGAAGGTPPYTFLWDNGVTTPDNVNLPEGIYTVTVTDANGCTSTCSVLLGVAPTAKVGDFVWEDLDEDGFQDPSEPGFPNVCVDLTGTDENGNPVALSTTTDADGMYLFDPIPPGTYKLTFCLPPNYVFTVANAGTDDALDSDVDPGSAMTEFFTLVDGDCDLSWDAGVFLFCENVTDPGQIAGDEFLCGPGNDPSPIIEVVPPSGGSGALEYLWMFNTDGGPFDPNVWNPIPNSNSPNYDPGPISQTTYYIRCVRREGCVLYLESNIVVKEVGDDAVALIQGPGIVCVDEPTNFSALDNGPGATYSWDFDNDANPPTSDLLSVDVTWSSTGLKHVILEVENNGCISYADFPIIVTNSPIHCSSLFMLQAELDEDFEVALDWVIGSLDTPHEFTVQRAVEGSEFINLATMDYVFDQEHFHYQDLTPPEGEVRYRILLEDEEGGQAYSNIVVLQVDLPAATHNEKARAYPNPANEHLFVDLVDVHEHPSRIQLFGLNGQVCRDVIVPAGQTLVKIPIGDLPASVYFLSLTNEEGVSEMIRIIKQ